MQWMKRAPLSLIECEGIIEVLCTDLIGWKIHHDANMIVPNVSQLRDELSDRVAGGMCSIDAKDRSACVYD